jgi:hypothetical protein
VLSDDKNVEEEGYPFGMVTVAKEQGKSWAEQEKERDDAGFKPVR